MERLGRLATAGWWATTIVAVQVTFVENGNNGVVSTPRRDLVAPFQSGHSIFLSNYPFLFPSISHFLEPCGHRLYFHLFYSFFSSTHIDASNRKGRRLFFWSRPSISLAFSYFPSAPRRRPSLVFPPPNSPKSCAIEYLTSAFSSLSLAPFSVFSPPQHPHHLGPPRRRRCTVARRTAIRSISQWSLRRCRRLTRSFVFLFPCALADSLSGVVVVVVVFVVVIVLPGLLPRHALSR